MQIDLFLHMFFAPESDIPKYNNVLTRTDLFSQQTDIDRKAHRIELYIHFNSKLLLLQF